ncbi:hypothetical protein N752_05090 [Desulforamulus aquiferis]|nr:hypothetical protein [Desulforamulus aquiferis]RYD06268.1 hypothetical protein N752_05090 [Desulforamulus aquiferis]
MGLIVFIHGMGNNPNRYYWREWGDQLLPYLLKQGIDLGEINFDGVYYYDLVPQPGDGWKKITSFFIEILLVTCEGKCGIILLKVGTSVECWGVAP